MLRRALLSTLAAAAALGLVSDAAFAGPRPGVQLHLLWEGVTGREVSRQLDRAAAANAAIVRVDVGWSSLEPRAKGRWDRARLRRLDAVVAKARARDLDLLLTLADSPCWASSAPYVARAGCRGRWWQRGVHRYLPRRPRDYADALAFLARRYGTRVAAWELWNEPNHEEFSRGPDKARRYAALVRAAYPRAKRAAPRATFVAGALSEADTAFAEALYAAGIGGAFDAFSVHPYSQDVSPLDPRAGADVRVSFAGGVPAVRDVMLRHGDGRPLWITEFGWNTSRLRDADPWRDGVPEPVQAEYVRQALAHVATWDYVPVAIYYGLKDVSRDPWNPLANFGLLRHDGSPKPALGAFRAAAGALRAGARVSAPPCSARRRLPACHTAAKDPQ